MPSVIDPKLWIPERWELRYRRWRIRLASRRLEDECTTDIRNATRDYPDSKNLDNLVEDIVSRFGSDQEFIEDDLAGIESKLALLGSVRSDGEYAASIWLATAFAGAGANTSRESSVSSAAQYSRPVARWR